MRNIQPGDIISFSAGTFSESAESFRRVTPAKGFSELLKAHRPDLLQLIGVGLPLVVNAYPAPMSAAAFGVNLDSYMSEKTVKRAWRLAASRAMPFILIGQPLFVADLMLAMAQVDVAPPSILIVSGGYWMPQSLERFLRRTILPKLGDRIGILHGYGCAEIDAAVLLGWDRDDRGEVVYRRRDSDIEVRIQEGEILLRKHTDEDVTPWFRTGDSGRETADGIVVESHRRIAGVVREELESWNVVEWSRYTGYFGWWDETRCLQVRAGLAPQGPQEVEFWDFARRQKQFTWLCKPNWTGRT